MGEVKVCGIISRLAKKDQEASNVKANSTWAAPGAALLGILALCACTGPRLEVAAAPSQPSVTLSDAEIQFTALPNTWNGYPSDLNSYYTPVEVRIQSDRNEEVQVRYGDFVLMDDARNQYQPVAPAEVARAMLGGRWPYGTPAAGPLSPPPPLLTGPWWPYGWPYRPWYPYSPFAPDPFYPDYYWWYRPTGYDILTKALREGRVLPGAQVEGFLYFQNATQKGHLLTLSWTPVSSADKPLTTFSTQFRIVR